MPQELRVVRCFQCLKFQVDIVKKANKWVCKVCGVKQSLMKEIFRGAGKECRAVVQELTARNIANDEQEAKVAELVLQNNIPLPKPVNMPTMEPFPRESSSPHGSYAADVVPSKWTSFVSVKGEEDRSECLDLEKALAQVSTTSFDRERVNVITRKDGESSTSKWTNLRYARDDASREDDFGGMAGQSSFVLRAEEPSKPGIYNPKRRTGNNVLIEENTTHSSIGNDQNPKPSHSTGNHSQTLLDFHKKSLKEYKAQERGTIVSSSSCHSRNEQVVAGCKKRKQLSTTATPLMNFGKRNSNESASVVPEGDRDFLFHSVSKKQNLEKASTESSSKWSKFLVQNEETNENNEDILHLFE